LEAYCVKCKTKREILQPEAAFNAANAPVTRGICGVCGTRLFRMGRTPAHDGMKPPERDDAIQRSGKLVIVESPAKAKTVGRFLGKGYTVKASVGHVRDLLRSELSVDVEHGFVPKYRVPNEKRQVVKELKALAQHAEEVFLATDPDREGEAIAWHCWKPPRSIQSFQSGLCSMKLPSRQLRMHFPTQDKLIWNWWDAQQARRVLDRLVGYSISPILWEKVRSRCLQDASSLSLCV